MTNAEKLMQLIPDNQTCAVISNGINRRYFTGFKSSDGIFICFKDKAYFIIDFRYYEKASEKVDCCEVILQNERTEQIRELFKKHNVSSVMIESDTMTVSELRHFSEAFSEMKIDSSDKLSCYINSLRIIKTPDEISKMSAAQNISEETFEYILQNIKRGMTEREVALIMDTKMKQLGAEDISFDTIVLNGKNTSLPHGVPGKTEMSDGFVLMDFGAVVDGYHSDMTRTFYIGTPSEEEKSAYDTVLNAQLKALENIRTGMTCKELDAVARNYIDEQGYKGAFGHSLGHGVGMEIHESPYVSFRKDTILEEGMVITIEPGIYLPGKFGIRIEDMVVLNNKSYVNFTNSPKELITL